MRTKRGCVGSVVLVASILVCSAGVAGDQIVFGGYRMPRWSEAAGRKLDLQVPARAVVGFPTVIRLSISISRPEYPEWLVDLAADRDLAIADLALGFDSDAGDGYQLGTSGLWDDHPSGDAQGPKVILKAGDGVTYWFDAARLARSKRIGAIWGKPKVQGREYTRVVKEPLPVVGTWSVSVIARDLVSLHKQTIDVREPNPDEKRIMELLETKGAGLSWFPDVVLEGGEIPEELVRPLPVETRRTVRLIQILRAAVVSPQDGLDAIYLYSAEKWGYLDALVDLVQYECLRDVNKGKEAETVRARWKDDNALIVNFRLVDEGMGLIARFHKDIEQRRLEEQLAKRPRMQNR